MADPAFAAFLAAPGGGPRLAGGGHIISPLFSTTDPRSTSLLKSTLKPPVFSVPNSPMYL